MFKNLFNTEKTQPIVVVPNNNKGYNIEDTILKAENINLSYDGRKILENVSFEIKNITRPGISQGQVISLIGQSGIGKSQLFKIIAGLNKLRYPNSGQVLLGQDQHKVKEGEVGIVYQNYPLFEHRTILKNLQLATIKANESLIQVYSEKFNLTQHLNKYPGQLSGGQRQRVSIVQQLLTGNQFILLDEPFSGLDCIMVDKISAIIRQISLENEYNTFIIISHDLEASLALSDTAFVLAKPTPENGATIIKTIDLAALGLAWQEDIKDKPAFRALLNEIKTII